MTKSQKLEKLNNLKNEIRYLATQQVINLDFLGANYIGSQPSVKAFFKLGILAGYFDDMTKENTFLDYFCDYEKKYEFNSHLERKKMYLDFSNHVIKFNPEKLA